MKDYEKRIYLEKRLRWAEHEYGKYANAVENQKNNIAVIKKRHEIIEKEQALILANSEDDKAQFFGIMKECKRQLKSHKAPKKKIPQKKAPPPPPKEPVLLPKKPEIEEIAVEIAEHQESTITQIKEAVNAEHKKVVVEGKTQCPECIAQGVPPGDCWYTRGGAFASHYKSHFRNGNVNTNGG